MDFLRLVINLSTDLNFGHKVILVACLLLGFARKKMRCLYSTTTELLFLRIKVLDFCFNNGHSWKLKVSIYRYFPKFKLSLVLLAG